MFSKIEVNGENTHPLYKFLKKEIVRPTDGYDSSRWMD